MPTRIMWDALERSQMFTNLAPIGKMFSAMAASESTVERSFSTARRFLSTRQSSKPDLLCAYIHLNTKKDHVYDNDIIEEKQSMQIYDRETQQTPKQQSLKNFFDVIPK